MSDRAADWTPVYSRKALGERGKAVVRKAGKQILLWDTGETIYACNNRCPHEGFPLAEGTLANDCVLTCNWHNWKFDLSSGETLVGGDALRRYPLRIDGDDILLDLADPPPETVRRAALDGLREAFGEHDYERIARELARYERAGGDVHEALISAFAWACDQFEFGMTHAQAAAADWLTLRDGLAAAEPSDRLVPAVEIIGHLAWDCRMDEGPFPFAEGQADTYDAAALETAIEDEDEPQAVALVRAGLAESGPELLRPALERAALRHYQTFGHTPIYLEKTYELIARLGDDAAEVLILPLVRGLCMGAREDLIPEFRAYAPTLEIWKPDGDDVPSAEDFRGKGVKPALEMIASAGGKIDALYDVLMKASADAMLHFDPRYRHHVDRPIQENIDWLDFTHAITHLNAARKICAHQPDLWPNAVLQTGCFLGRNANYSDWSMDVDRWAVDDPDAFLDEVLSGMLDHGEPLYIFPAHVLKLATAIKEEIAEKPDAAFVAPLLAALNRFVHEPIKKKHARRVARQAMSFVEAQG